MKRIVLFALFLLGAYTSKAQLKGEDFSDYHPHGCTPLYDAMGLSLIRLHEKVKGDKEASVVVTVLTDGLENASHEWRVTDLRRLIEQLKEDYIRTGRSKGIGEGRITWLHAFRNSMISL